MLIIAMDANFRLKNRLRKNEHKDESLGPGWSYFVEDGKYKEHLRDYVSEADVSHSEWDGHHLTAVQISTCIAFAALMQKDSKLTTGLRCSGAGGCVCARHESVRPNGMGDLQKGER